MRHLVSLLSCVSLLFTIALAQHHFSILHTTDLHGYVAGHRHDPYLNSDLGDFVSVVSHLRKNAAASGTHLLVVDTGDLIMGTGYSDASEVHGEKIYPLIAQLDYDALTIGNHDMDEGDSVTLEHEILLAAFGEKFLSSNSIWTPDGTFFGQQYLVKEWESGASALIFGFMYDYYKSSDLVETIAPEVSVAEDYFHKALLSNVDVVVVLAHIDPEKIRDTQTIFKAVRDIRPEVPFVFLAGHNHVKYFDWLDENAVVMESGRYFETLGTLTFDIGESGVLENLEQAFVPTNIELLMEMAQVDSIEDFNTPEGDELKAQIADIAAELGIDELVGCAEHTWSRYTHRGEDFALWDLFLGSMIPDVYFDSDLELDQVFVANEYSLRDHLYEGEVLVDDMYGIIPFLDRPQVVSGVSGELLIDLFNEMSVDVPPSDDRFAHYMATIAKADLVPDQEYDLSSGSYDMVSILQTLTDLTGDTWEAVEYSGPFNTHETVREWVQTHWSC